MASEDLEKLEKRVKELEEWVDDVSDSIPQKEVTDFQNRHGIVSCPIGNLYDADGKLVQPILAAIQK